MNERIDLPAIEAFLFKEAQLLDERRYDEWVDLFSEDGVYWVPSGQAGNVEQSVALIYDNVPRLKERMLRQKAHTFWAQQPPTLTTRLVSNVTAQTTAEGELSVDSRFIICLLRRNESTLLSGVARYVLIPHGTGFAIRKRVIDLQQRDQSFDNLTFLI